MNSNPLQQYFRRPAVHMRLPSDGKYYDSSVIDIPESGELPVFPMTAIDEITVKTPDALFNGSAVADLIKSCVPCIKNPWAINGVDLDAILVAIRMASGRQNLEFETECPKCNTVSPYKLDLAYILPQLKDPDYSSLLSLGQLEIKFKALSYKEMNEIALLQFELQKEFANIDNETDEEIKKQRTSVVLKKVTEATMHVISHAIEYIKTPNTLVDEKDFIYEFLQNCDNTSYVAIRDKQAELKSSSDIKPLNIKCGSCGFEFTQPFTLNTSDFFV